MDLPSNPGILREEVESFDYAATLNLDLRFLSACFFF